MPITYVLTSKPWSSCREDGWRMVPCVPQPDVPSHASTGTHWCSPGGRRVAIMKRQELNQLKRWHG
eukprot:COSAG02_NODE_4741_length_5035_cov_2.309562_6_plen_66_part_00